MAGTGDRQIARRGFRIAGIVQGVGFRPFVFRLASQLGLTGWVRNSPAGVELELQGAEGLLEQFVIRLYEELPPLAVISGFESSEITPVADESAFEILASSDGPVEAQIAPDSTLCADCQRELFDSDDRRHRHPFITCTNCGPRWTIVTGIPYDRPLTTMATFPLCEACLAEYGDPLDRRFHAQPIACPACGPQLALLDAAGSRLAAGASSIRQVVDQLQQGQIVAVKGLGGYHLAVDALNDAAVARLRSCKLRDEKPFAVMVADLETARQLAEMTGLEERLLAGPEAPVVIVRSRVDSPVSAKVAPGSGWIGLMLAYTALHQLLFRDTGLMALVMTSANSSDQPMVSDDQQALLELAGMADLFLIHNRPIQVRTDDSVLRVFQGRPLFYRRSRGDVPRPVGLPMDAGQILAVGGELKNTICLTRGRQAFVSQHIGDLKNEATLDTFRQTIEHLQTILEIRPQIVACDQHPDYLSTRYAEQTGLPLVKVQHHHAHLAACMAENNLDGELIGVIFDGTGLGDDGTVWGGEFLTGGYAGVQRSGHLQQVRLLGGDAAAREPWRMALAWLYQECGEAVWQINSMPQLDQPQRQLLTVMLQKGLNAPLTSSAGRLFDAAAFLVGAAQHNSFDGQAAMALEALAETVQQPVVLPQVRLTEKAGEPFQLDCCALLKGLADGVRTGADSARLALGFHHALATAVAAGCDIIRRENGLDRVVLSGGVFQNRLLSELVYTSLSEQGFTVFTHHLVPPNDGGIALGQAAVAARIVQGER